MLCLLLCRPQGVPRGKSETSVPHTGSTGDDGLDAVSVTCIVDGVQHDAGDLRVTIVDHLHAAHLDLTALRRPKPPAARGWVPPRVRTTKPPRHQHPPMNKNNPRSDCRGRWRNQGRDQAGDPQEEIGSQRALQVLNGRNSCQECGVLANFGLQLVENELPCAHWCAQNGDSPLAWPAVKITSPHSGIRVDTCGGSLQSLDPRWGLLHSC